MDEAIKNTKEFGEKMKELMIQQEPILQSGKWKIQALKMAHFESFESLVKRGKINKDTKFQAFEL